MFKSTIYITLFFLLIGFSGNLSAQIIKGEAILGMNLTQVDGDEVYGFNKIGANVGVGVLIPFDKKGKWDISIEALFSQKGAYQGKQYEDVDSSGNQLTGEYKLNLNYAEVPVLVLFTDKDFISVGAGFSWGRLVSVKEWEHGQLVETTDANSGTYDKNDFSILADARIRIWKGLKFNLRYQYSLVKIRTREFEDYNGNTWTRNQFNNVISFRLIYIFNEKKSQDYYENARVQ